MTHKEDSNSVTYRVRWLQGTLSDGELTHEMGWQEHMTQQHERKLADVTRKAPSTERESEEPTRACRRANSEATVPAMRKATLR